MEETVVLDFSEFKDSPPIKSEHRKSYFYKIEEYTLDGAYIRTWQSLAEAAEYHNIAMTTISGCVKGNTLFVKKVDRIFLKEGNSIEDRLDSIEKQQHDFTYKNYKIEIEEYDIHGNCIKSWESLTSIYSSNNPVTVRTVKNICEGKVLYSKKGKRIFLYAGTSIRNRLELIEKKKYENAMSVSINEYTKDGMLTKHWKSVKDIAADYHIDSVKVLDCCFGKSNSVKGKIYLFSGDSIEQRIKRIKSKKKIV